MRLRRSRKDDYAEWAEEAAVPWEPVGGLFRIREARSSTQVGVDGSWIYGIMYLTFKRPTRRSALDSAAPQESKTSVLRRHHALNARPQAVTDPAFTPGHPFFDRNDLVQVKYEMLRRVQTESQSVTRAAASFGFSRPSFYETQAVFQKAGVPGLVPQRPGPRRAHKLTEEVVGFLLQALADDSTLTSAELVQLVQDRFAVRVHPRSVERALARRKKGGRSAT